MASARMRNDSEYISTRTTECLRKQLAARMNNLRDKVKSEIGYGHPMGTLIGPVADNMERIFIELEMRSNGS